MGTQPTLKDIREAHTRIKPYIHRTPVLTCRAIDDMLGATLFFKCENLQKVGAFKIRGACNAVYSLDDTGSENGVAAHSSGNHAAALWPWLHDGEESRRMSSCLKIHLQ